MDLCLYAVDKRGYLIGNTNASITSIFWCARDKDAQFGYVCEAAFWNLYGLYKSIDPSFSQYHDRLSVFDCSSLNWIDITPEADCIKTLLFFCHTFGKLTFKKQVFMKTAPSILAISTRIEPIIDSTHEVNPDNASTASTPLIVADEADNSSNNINNASEAKSQGQEETSVPENISIVYNSEEPISSVEDEKDSSTEIVDTSVATIEENESSASEHPSKESETKKLNFTADHERTQIALDDVLHSLARNNNLSEEETTSMIAGIDQMIKSTADSFYLKSDNIFCRISRLSSDDSDQSFAELVQIIQKFGPSRVLVVLCAAEPPDIKSMSELLVINHFPAAPLFFDQRKSYRNRVWTDFMDGHKKILIADEQVARMIAGNPDAEFDHVVLMDCYESDSGAPKIISDMLFVRDHSHPIVMDSIHILCAPSYPLQKTQCVNIIRLVEIYSRICL